jgi:hypothetical protein
MVNSDGEKYVWSSESLDRGINSEESFEDILRNKFVLEEFTEEDEKAGKHFDKVRFRKTTKFEDEHHKGDFVLYRPETNEYIHLDLTTAREHEVTNYKEKNAEKSHMRLLVIPAHIIKQARQGCIPDQVTIQKLILKDVFNLE